MTGGVAPIMAPEEVLEANERAIPKPSPFPPGAWPTETFSQARKALYLNGEAVEVLRQPAAHSDGDSFVVFRHSDVVMAGDILDMTRFPGGRYRAGARSIRRARPTRLNRLLVLPVRPFVWREGGTYVIGGHGRICEQSDVVQYRDMVTIVRDIVKDMVQRGMTLNQIQAADPTKAYRKRYGSDTGPWTTNAFVEAIYKGLAGKK